MARSAVAARGCPADPGAEPAAGNCLRQRIDAGRQPDAMKRRWAAILAGVLAVLALFLFLNFRGSDRIHDAPPLTPPAGDSVARGAYLIRIGNCAACVL